MPDLASSQGRAPLVPFQRPSLPASEEVERYFAISRGQHGFSGEAACRQMLRERLEAVVGLACVPTASSTLGLLLVLRALRGGTDGARFAAMPSFAPVAAARAVLASGLEPLFVDIAPDHWQMSPEALERALAARRGSVAAVVAVSAFGTPPPPAVRDRWCELARSHRAPLVVESAAGFGAFAEDGLALGAQGDAEVVCFEPSRPLAAGGGAVFAADPKLAAEVRRLSELGLDENGHAVGDFGLDAMMDEQTAATALAALDTLDRSLASRRLRAERLLAALEGRVVRQEGAERGTWQFVPVAASGPDHRARILAAADGRVELRTDYGPLHRMPAFRDAAQAGPLAATEAIAAVIVNLPMAVDLDDGEIERIVTAMGDAEAGRANGRAGGQPQEDGAAKAAPGLIAERLAETAHGRLAAAVHERAARWPERLAEIRPTAEWERAYSEPEPLITVRIATCERPELLVERALASVRLQTYPHWEAVVVGDACGDDTAERIAALGDERISFHNLPVRGPYPTDPLRRRAVAGTPPMNVGALLARGRWIAPLDDDDAWDEDHLEVLLAAAQESRAEFVYGSVRDVHNGVSKGTTFGAWPPPGNTSMGAAIYNSALREFGYDMASVFRGEFGDQHLVRRMWEAGIRFEFIDRAVATHHTDHERAIMRSLLDGSGK